MEDKDYQGARVTFKAGLEHCPADKNLTSGLEKANKYIAVLESVQGGGESFEFDLDEPSRRNAADGGEASEPALDATSRKAPVAETDSEKKKDGDGENDTPEEEKWPGSAEVEIERIKRAPNHYAVLHVSMDASTAQMKKNYYLLARMLHPDRCQLDGASDAMTSVSQAYDTLSNLLKKTLYDQFLSQTGGDADQPNQTYQEWESRQQPTPLPKWLNFLLGIKGCGYVLVSIMAILVIPIILIFILLYLLYLVLWKLPYILVLLCFFPEKYARMRERERREIAKMEEEAQDRMHAHV